jgi:hypothetical protein
MITRRLYACELAVQTCATDRIATVVREGYVCERIFALRTGAAKLGHQAPSAPFFDTVTLDVSDAGKVCSAAVAAGYNLRQLDASRVSVAFDETTTIADVDALLAVLNGGSAPDFTAESLASSVRLGLPPYVSSRVASNTAPNAAGLNTPCVQPSPHVTVRHGHVGPICLWLQVASLYLPHTETQ